MKNKGMYTVELWDSLLFKIHNIFQNCIFWTSYFKLRTVLKKNEDFTDSHLGERCFIVLNGPSLLDLDVSKLVDETVFCVNHFWNSDLYSVVRPNYYLACDTQFFANHDSNNPESHLNNILKYTQNSAKCIFSSHYLESLGRSSVLPDNVYVTYSKHKATMGTVKTKLSSISSGFSTVALFAMNAALDMGFKEIYLLGYELPPWKGGLMPHAHKNTAAELQVEKNLTEDEDMYSQIALHWQYYQAQLENYYIASEAKKRNVRIYNCNAKSFVKAFDFVRYEDLF